MAHPEQPAQNIDMKILAIGNALDVLSLVFGTDASTERRTLDDGQCEGMRLLFSALKGKLYDVADAVGVLELNIQSLRERVEGHNGDLNKVWELGTELGAAVVREGEDHRQLRTAPDYIRQYVQGWIGDQSLVADQPVYPQVHPAAARMEEPDARTA